MEERPPGEAAGADRTEAIGFNAGSLQQDVQEGVCVHHVCVHTDSHTSVHAHSSVCSKDCKTRVAMPPGAQPLPWTETGSWEKQPIGLGQKVPDEPWDTVPAV